MNPAFEHITKLNMNAKPPAIKIPATLLPYVLTALLSGGSTYGLISYRVAALEKCSEKIQAEQQISRSDTAEMKTDLKWIREALSELKRRTR